MLTIITQIFALLAMIFAIAALVARARSTALRPFSPDRAPAKGNPGQGIMYAFTLGMMPWAKESTRRHLLAYLRGIAFHLGIFVGLAALVASPWWNLFPVEVRWLLAGIAGFGAIFGLAGELARWLEPNLRALSTPDDHASVLLVSVFLATTTAALLAESWLGIMYLTSAVMLVYIPLGKIRHCIYFPFSRRFFGLFIGRRAVIHHAEVTR